MSIKVSTDGRTVEKKAKDKSKKRKLEVEEVQHADQIEPSSKKAKKSKSKAQLEGANLVQQSSEPALRSKKIGEQPADSSHDVGAKKIKKSKKTKAGDSEAVKEEIETKPVTEKGEKKKKKSKSSASADTVSQPEDANVSSKSASAEDAAQDRTDGKTKSKKKSKKSKSAPEDESGELKSKNGETPDLHEAAMKPKSKKSKKQKKSKDSDEKEGHVVNGADKPEISEGKDAEPEEMESTDSKKRFVLFVGNLPYQAKKEHVEEHFAKLKPRSVRLLTNKDTGKFKGFCFVEFDKWDRLNTALQLYHHSTFMIDGDEKSARQINVELSAGGGGNTTNRKNKIKAKNAKLDDERKRVAAAKLEAEEQAKTAKEQGHGQIHPSRMAKMNMK